LLPPGVTAGSIVNIAVHQNHAEEKKRDDEFWSLQDEILETFGKHSPEPPKLNVCEISSAYTFIPLILNLLASERHTNVYHARMVPVGTRYFQVAFFGYLQEPAAPRIDPEPPPKYFYQVVWPRTGH